MSILRYTSAVIISPCWISRSEPMGVAHRPCVTLPVETSATNPLAGASLNCVSYQSILISMSQSSCNRYFTHGMNDEYAQITNHSHSTIISKSYYNCITTTPQVLHIIHYLKSHYLFIFVGNSLSIQFMLFISSFQSSKNSINKFISNKYITSSSFFYYPISIPTISTQLIPNSWSPLLPNTLRKVDMHKLKV